MPVLKLSRRTVYKLSVW